MTFSSAFFCACLAIAARLVAFQETNASPLVDHDDTHPLTSRATQAAPHWVIYSDKWISGENGPPSVNDIKVSSCCMLQIHSTRIFHTFRKARATTSCQRPALLVFLWLTMVIQRPFILAYIRPRRSSSRMDDARLGDSCLHQGFVCLCRN